VVIDSWLLFEKSFPYVVRYVFHLIPTLLFWTPRVISQVMSQQGYRFQQSCSHILLSAFLPNAEYVNFFHLVLHLGKRRFTMYWLGEIHLSSLARGREDPWRFYKVYEHHFTLNHARCCLSIMDIRYYINPNHPHQNLFQFQPVHNIYYYNRVVDLLL